MIGWYKERGENPKIPKRKTGSLLKAVETEIEHMHQQKDNQRISEAFIIQFPYNTNEYLRLAEIANKNRCPGIRVSFLNLAHRKAAEEEKERVNAAIAVAAKEYLIPEHFNYSRFLHSVLEQPFPFEQAYTTLLAELNSRAKKGNLSLSVQKDLFNTLKEAPVEVLASIAQDLSTKVKGIKAEATLKNSAESYYHCTLYLLGKSCFEKIKDEEGLLNLAKVGIEQGLEQKSSLLMQYPALRKRADELPEPNPSPEPEEEDSEPPRLPGFRELFFAQEGTAKRILKIYEQKGIEGIDKEIRRYAAKSEGARIREVYSAHPLEILEQALHLEERKIAPEDSVKITRYALIHGIPTGLGYSALYQVMETPALKKKVPREEWALGITNLLLNPSHDLTTAIDIAEMLGEVPLHLYKEKGLEELGYAIQFSMVEDWKIDAGYIYGAKENLRKYGDRGLLSFVEKNFPSVKN